MMSPISVAVAACVLAADPTATLVGRFAVAQGNTRLPLPKVKKLVHAERLVLELRHGRRVVDHLFQVFHPRQLKDGYFIAYLPPGAYELDYLSGSSTTWNISDESSVRSRFYVTRPGVYDIGTVRVTEPYPFLPTFTLDFLPPPATPERREVLRGVVSGTHWAELLAQRP